MTPQDAPGTFILSREDESYPLRKRSAPEGFYEGQEGGKARSSPRQPWPDRILPVEDNGKTNGRPRISRTIHPPVLDVAAAAVLVPGAAPKERAPCAVGQGGSEVVSGVPRAETIWERIQPRESGVS